MFDQIGKKLKNLASFLSWIGIIASVIAGIACMSLARNTAVFLIVGLVIAVLGSILSVVGSWALYGFGELIDQVCSIRQVLGVAQTSAAVENIANDFEVLKNLHDKGLISDEEYSERGGK